MKKPTYSKTKIRFKCPDCGSSVHRDIIEGVVIEHCIGDLMQDHNDYFHWFQKQVDALKVILMVDWNEIKQSLYGQWYLAQVDQFEKFECNWKIDPRAKLMSPSKCGVTLPDTAQVMIAEAILKRPLTEQELTGSRHIPVILEDGARSEASIDHYLFPQDVSLKYKDLHENHVMSYCPKIFNWEDL